MIAMALAPQPKPLIADEPTTALDVTRSSRDTPGPAKCDIFSVAFAYYPPEEALAHLW
jgi:hypothetical protein